MQIFRSPKSKNISSNENDNDNASNSRLAKLIAKNSNKIKYFEINVTLSNTYLLRVKSG